MILEHTPLGNRCYKGSWNIGTYNKLTHPFPPYLSPSLCLFLLLPMSHWIYVFLTFLCAICFLRWPFFYFLFAFLYQLINSFWSITSLLVSFKSLCPVLVSHPNSMDLQLAVCFHLVVFVLLDTLQIILATFHLYPTWLQIKVLSQSFYFSMTSPFYLSSRPKLLEVIVNFLLTKSCHSCFKISVTLHFYYHQ